MNWTVSKLNATHDRAAFQCGNLQLDIFLKKLAGQYSRRDIGQTYVATLPDETRILGYYTLSASHVLFSDLPPQSAKGLPHSPLPVVLLGRLAVDLSAQGQSLGRVLLVRALRKSEELSRDIGIAAVEVHAIDDRARAFYQHYGFTGLVDDPFHLYLPMKLIRRLVATNPAQ